MTISQIKEKFGALRFYVGGGFNEARPDVYYRFPSVEHIRAVIAFAETYSECCCDTTGTIRNVVQLPGWVRYRSREALPTELHTQLEDAPLHVSPLLEHVIALDPYTPPG